jgi:predicted 2-oxoglutarate/Fe(II)-dependent dioxygenase YbiX
MTVNPLLASIGVRVFDDVLDPSLLAELAEAMAVGVAQPALVYSAADGERVDEAIRRTREVQVPAALAQRVRSVLADVVAEMAPPFEPPLVAPAELQFLRYGPGDLFIAHQDVLDGDRFAPRRLSLVLFVNDASRGASSGTAYDGGALLFRAFDDDEAGGFGLGLEQKAGRLVTFPSSLWHEVKPVTAGVRFTVVGWAT